MIINRRLIHVALVLLGCAGSVFASNFSFTGTFIYDNDVQLFNLNLSADGSITLQTLGYGGGTNAAGQTILPGGFEPILQIYNASGLAVGGEIDPVGPCTPPQPDPARNYYCHDAYAPGVFLTAGNYIVAMTQSPNTPNGNLSDGFFYDGVDNQYFNNGFGNGLTGSFFYQGTGNWALDILNVDSASVQTTAPEPNSAVLAAAAIILAGLNVRKRRSRDCS
jgi:hypothetical protein